MAFMTDPNIALQGKPIDYNEILRNGAALKNAGIQSQLGTLQLKQAGQDYQDTQAERSAISQNIGADGTLNRAGVVNQLYQSAPTRGLAVQQQFTQQDLANREASAKLQKAQVDAAKAHVDYIDQTLQGVKDQPSYTAAVQSAMQTGVVKPGELPDVYDPDLVSRLHAQALTQKDALTAKQKELDAAETVRHNSQTETTAAATQAETAKYHGVESKQRQQEIGIQGARLNLEKQKLGTDQGAAVEQQAQQIANGDVKALSLSRNNPYSRAVMARVYEINPKYTDSLYTATQDLRSSKPNSMGGNVGRLGTAILHADEALKGSGDLGFSEGLLTGVGTQGTAAYRQSAEFLTGEIGQYVEGGKLTNGQGNDLKKDLFSSRQGVRDSAIHQIIALSKGKLQSQMEQFKNATQTDFPSERVFNDPTIKGALQKHGVIDGSSQQGGSYSQTATGPNNHKIGSNDGGKTWIDVQTGKAIQ